MSEEQLQQALNKCYFFLKFRPRSEAEMVAYLDKKAKRFKWGQELIDKTINSLKEQELIDDRKFIDWYVNKSSKIKIQSSKLIRQGLRRYGVNNFLIEDFLVENEVDEEGLLKKLLSQKWSSWDRLDKRKRFQKVVAYLQRRGFHYALIKKAIAEHEAK